MIFRRCATAALLVAFALGAAPATDQPAPSAKPLVVQPVAAAAVNFEAPAGSRPAGPLDAIDPFSQILPSGRIVRPAGTSVVVGMNALGVALSPDGRYAIVSNDSEREAGTFSMLDGLSSGGYSLAVVDTGSMAVVDRYRANGEKFFMGIVAVHDPLDPAATLVLAAGGGANAVYAFDLDANGHLTPDAHHVIPVPGPRDAAFANAGKSFPGTLVPSPDGAHVYVIDNVGNDVSTLDTRTRALTGVQVPVGFFPLGAALTPSGLLVANEGLLDYRVLPSPVAVPAFAIPPPEPERASALTLLTLDSAGVASAVDGVLPVDQVPDGLRIVGGAHPAAIAAMRTKPYAFVAMSNVDRIATIFVGTQTRAVGGTELRLFDRGPYGTQPDALVLSRDERRLYVALAGIDAIAVLDVTDPIHPHRLGLIPAGWDPAALALSRDGRYLFVANAKGFNHDRGFVGDSTAVWATLQRIDLAAIDLRKTTMQTLTYQRVLRPAHAGGVVPALQSGGKRSAYIKHVVFILEESKSYDSMLGDLTDAAGAPYGPGDPSLVAFGQNVTPNLHELARSYALAGNYYADAEESDAGHQFAAAGISSVYTERTLFVKNGRRQLVNANQDPEDYQRAGSIFNSLALHQRAFRDYGEFVRLAGYDEGDGSDPRADDAQGLGGLYALDGPAPAALAGHVDLNYPGWNLRIRDVRRAQEFERDFDTLVRAGRMPEFTYIWLPGDRGVSGKNVPPLAEQVADGDRALGTIVDYLTHLPEWPSTAIFITPADAQSSRDHVNANRSYAIVVSPYAKRKFVGMRHTSTAGILKTEEELLGLPPLSLGDALATDFSDFFQPIPNPAAFERIDVPQQTALAEKGAPAVR
jgi:YVTN family beta-propeller protein